MKNINIFIYFQTNSGSWDAAATYIQAIALMMDVDISGRYCEGETCNAIGKVQ